MGKKPNRPPRANQSRLNQQATTQEIVTPYIEPVFHGSYVAVAPTTWTATTTVREEQVDSWRSYANDASNLQSLSAYKPTSSLNPAAAEFTSVLQQTYRPTLFAPYQPLRFSNGQRERQIVQQARSHTTTQLQTHLQKFPEHAPDGESSTILPSVEQDFQGVSAVALGPDGANTIVKPRRRPAGSKVRDPGQSHRAMSTHTPEPPPAPSPSSAYTLQAGLEPVQLEQAQRLLVILDLNGTLLHRKNRAKNPTSFHVRPGVTNLLEYLFANHNVMVYTSTRAENAAAIVSKLLSTKQRNQMTALWARDKLDLTKEQYNSKVQVYKKLEKVWNDGQIQATAGEGRCWDQSNTVLIDDSHLKAMAQPHNLIQVPEFINDRPKDDKSAFKHWNKDQQEILKQLQVKLEELKWTSDVSRLIRLWQIAEQADVIIPGSKDAGDKGIDLEKDRLLQQGDITVDMDEIDQLPNSDKAR